MARIDHYCFFVCTEGTVYHTDGARLGMAVRRSYPSCPNSSVNLVCLERSSELTVGRDRPIAFSKSRCAVRGQRAAVRCRRVRR